MATLDSKSKVLIIGGGPGGLALAQILRNSGIPYELFEREEAATGRAQGWAVALIESLTDLQALLPTDIGDLVTTSVNHGPPCPSLDSITLLNALNNQSLGTLGGVSPGRPGYLLRVGRERLRYFLATYLSISYNKKFTHYTTSPTGVTAFFADGTFATGTLLVGADGAHSAVRNQLLSNPPPLQSTIVPIVGEVTLPYEKYAPYHQRGSAAVISSAANIRYMIGLRSMAPDRSSALYYWALCFHTEQPEEDADWAETATQRDFYERALQLTEGLGLDPFFTDIIKYTGVQGMKAPPLRFREFVPPKKFPTGAASPAGGYVARRATLMGDAAHSMIPFCVAGANTALQDGCDLARIIVHGVREGRGVEDVLKEYEEIMLPRGRRSVLASHRVGDTGDLTDLVRRGRQRLEGAVGMEEGTKKGGDGSVGKGRVQGRL